MLARVFLAIPDGAARGRLRKLLTNLGLDVRVARLARGYWSRLARESADLVLVSRSRIPSPLQDSLRILRDSPDAPEVVVVTDREDPEERARLVAAGCEAVVSSEVSDEALSGLIATLLERRSARTAEHLMRGAPGAPRLSDFVSASPAMQAFMDVVAQVVPSDSSLLLLGETGVGKERLARAIHAEGRRATGPFVAVNCGGLPEGLFESELFGHEEGAFTGATRTRRGWFELAHGGTLFLDEIGEMPLHLQVKVLRALQEREFQPVGSERTIRTDVRIMAASNRDLEEAARQGSFRRDLYYRLSVVTLSLPSLRDRREDIPVLAESYVEHFNGVIGREVEGVSDRAMTALESYDWPGNVRELVNVIERAVLLSRGRSIEPGDLPESIAGRADPLAPLSADPTAAGLDEATAEELALRPWSEVRAEALARVERVYLHALLSSLDGRIGAAAERAGISPRSLYEKMRAHGLRKEDYRG